MNFVYEGNRLVCTLLIFIKQRQNWRANEEGECLQRFGDQFPIILGGIFFFTATIQLEHKVPTSADENNIKSRERIRQVVLVFCPSLSIQMDLKQLIFGWLAMVYDGRRYGQ